ncbi:MAG: hypothetical protein AB7K71_23930 [Polyangiaceae bacterium]
MSYGYTWIARRTLAALIAASALAGSSAAQAQDPGVVVPPPPPPPPPPANGGWAGSGGAAGWGSQAPVGPAPSGPVGPMDSRSGLVKVTLESAEPGVRVELHHLRADPENSEPIVSCVDRCSTWVQRGRYKFYTVGDGSFLSGSREIDIQDDVTIVIDPDTTEHRTVGLVLGVGGIIGMGVGLSLLLNAAVQGNDSKAEAGAWVFLGSLAAVPIGWVMFGTSFKPEWSEHYDGDRDAKSKPPEPQWTVGFAPTKGGGLLGASLTF